MFGSTNPFGQSSSSPFGGSQSVFGQNNASNNPFAAKPFGSTTPFGAQTGTSMFGGTSTGVFGATPQTPSPFSSTPAFGASSTPAFGASSSPAFGSSTPAFGASSSPAFGGSSIFGQKPAFGGFGSTPSQPSPFGSTSQPSQPAFGSGMFGASTPFGASSQSPFGAASTSAFGATSTPAFGATSNPAFGTTSTPAFGANSTPAFGATTTPAFGSATTPTFGSSGTAFGASTPQLFSSTPAFGSSATPAFGASTTAGFGAQSTPSFSFGGSSPAAFGQPTSSTFGTSSFGSQPSPFGTPIGGQQQPTTFSSSGFAQPGFSGQQRGGSRVATYTATVEADGGGSSTQPAGKLESISAMPAYKDKSHEELRWEDYQLGDKGGPNPSGQTSGGIGFNQPTPAAPSFNQQPSFSTTTAPNPFASNASSNPFSQKPISSTGFSIPSTSPFGQSSTGVTNAFGPTTTPSSFTGNTSSSLFPSSGSSAFSSSSSLFSTTMQNGTFNSSFTQPSPLFSSTSQTISTFGPNTSSFAQTTPSPFSQNATSSFNLFNQASTGTGGNIFSSTPPLLSSSTPGAFSQSTPSFSSAFQPQQPQSTSTFSFSNLPQTQPAGQGGFMGGQSMFNQGNLGQQPSANLSPAVVQSAPPTNPFGMLPAMPQMSIGRGGTGSSIQYGISSMPVVDKPAPVRVSSLLTSRHLSQTRLRLPARKYHPKEDHQKVAFFSDQEETSSTPKADAFFMPRENPRALVIRPSEHWPARTSVEKPSPLKDTSVRENGKRTEGVSPAKSPNSTDKGKAVAEDDGQMEAEEEEETSTRQKSNGFDQDSYKTLTAHRAGEAAIVYEHGADIEALMPKLRQSDYYTEPRIQELAAKERAEPGFCRHVSDFVVGRHGYGSIKFLGETDVRRLDLESLIQFNNREVIVYMDDDKKPPVGQGLNKPAEVTLLNIKCFDKNSGQQVTEGSRIKRYVEMLRKKAESQGAEFVSYDSVKGEWKFKVEHFSKYGFGDEEED